MHNPTFYLHNTRAEFCPLILGLLWSDTCIVFADDGFGNFMSVDLSLSVIGGQYTH